MKVACLALHRKKFGGATTYNLSMQDLLKDRSDIQADFYEIAGVDRKTISMCPNSFTSINYRDEESKKAFDDYDFLHLLSGKKYTEDSKELEFLKDILSKKPWIITLHGCYELKFYPWLADMMKLPTCRGYIVVRQQLAEFYKDQIPSHLNSKEVGIYLKPSDNKPSEDKTDWVFAARIAMQKGIKEFMLLSEHAKDPVRIHGRGYGMESKVLQDNLDVLCENNSNIVCKGKYNPEDTPQIYSKAKVAFDLSKYDVMGGIQYVTLEAMEANAIVVAFDTINFHPILKDAVIYINRNELLENPKSVYDKINSKLEDKEWVNQALQTYKKALSTIFSADYVADNLVSFYHEIHNKHSEFEDWLKQK